MNFLSSTKRLLPWLGCALLLATGCRTPLAGSDTHAVESVVGRLSPVPVAATSDRLDKEYYAEEGGILRVGGHLWGIQGEFDGNTVLVLEDDTVIVPEYDPTFAPEIGFGYRGRIYGMEVTYKRFESEGEFQGGTDDDLWNYIDLDFKQYYRTSTQLQPYVSLGMGYFFGTINNGASDGTIVKDSDFSGVSLNIGGGIAFYLSERLAIDARAIYRYSEMLEVDTISSGSRSIEDGLDASGYGVSIGLTYTLN